jgi:multidrug transporter EmrE-like cation transporter
MKFSSMLLLFIAIAGEVIGTASLKASQGFTKLIPSILVIIGYGFSFFLFSHSLKGIPLGVAYAIWSGVGTAAIVIIGYYWFGESLSIIQIAAIILIIIASIILNISPSGL